MYKSQSSRIDDQRCEFPFPKRNNTGRTGTSTPLKGPVHPAYSVNQPDFIEMVAKIQGDRLDEQRCEFPLLPGLDSRSRFSFI